MTRRPDRFRAYATMTFGALVTTLTGTCTAWIGGWTFPAYLFSHTYESSYSLLFLWPGLLIGADSVYVGAVIFGIGHADLGARRPDRIDLVASGATMLAALGWCVAFLVMLAASVHQLLDPAPDRGGQLWEQALWLVALVGAPAVLAAYVAFRAFQRLRAAAAPHLKERPDDR